MSPVLGNCELCFAPLTYRFRRIEQYLDFSSVYAASFAEEAHTALAPHVTRVCARYARFFNAVS